MHKKMLGLLLVALSVGIWTNLQVVVLADSNDNDGNGHKITVLDSCDPNDADWAPTGGCFLKNGSVPLSEFNAFLFSPLGGGAAKGILIGHTAWRNDPSYLKVKPGKTIHVDNKGGRTHSFTEVANFGGGVVPPLNGGLTTAPECNGFTPLPAGDKIAVAGLAKGVHTFQCCIHPWMRATIRVD